MSSTKVITGKQCVFSYANVFEPKGIQGSEPKYSVAVLIPKSDTKTIKACEAAIDAALEEGKSKKFSGKLPPKATLKLPLRDGDEERPDDEAYQGMMFFNASSKSKPGVVDGDLNPILDAEEFYSGCVGRASVNFYAFNTNGNKGVAVGLNNIQKIEDGERLSGGSSAEEDFGEDSDDLAS
jgi:hypothetical protein